MLSNPGGAAPKGDTKRARKAMTTEVKALRPPMRGWLGRGRGSSSYVQAADEWRGTTVQVCGMWPYAVGAGAPMVGVPLGRHIHTGATLCCDPISWFQRAKLISNPSAFVLGKPGLGKSIEIFTNALKSGRPIIVQTAHYGEWELFSLAICPTS